MKIFFYVRFFSKNGISNLALHSYRVYQRINRISEVNTRLIRASRLELQKGLLIRGYCGLPFIYSEKNNPSKGISAKAREEKGINFNLGN